MVRVCLCVCVLCTRTLTSTYDGMPMEVRGQLLLLYMGHRLYFKPPDLCGNHLYPLCHPVSLSRASQTLRVSSCRCRALDTEGSLLFTVEPDHLLWSQFLSIKQISLSYYLHMLTAALFTISEKWSQSVSLNKWMGNVVHIPSGILFSCKDKWNHESFRKMMDLESMILRELTQTQKEKAEYLGLHMGPSL